MKGYKYYKETHIYLYLKHHLSKQNVVIKDVTFTYVQERAFILCTFRTNQRVGEIWGNGKRRLDEVAKKKKKKR